LLGRPRRAAGPAGRRRLAAGKVEGAERIEIHRLDVAADAPFAEAERHPRLEPGEHARPDGWMGGEIKVEPVGPGVHETPEPRRAPPIEGLQGIRVHEESLPEILPQRSL